MKTCVSVFALAALAALTACNVLPEPQADTVRHFTLSGAAGSLPGAHGTVVRPVQLAGHLHNRSMAVRIADHEVTYLEDVRWAEPLDDAIVQLLRARLGSMEGGTSVTVQVQRCELVRFEGNRVQVTASYAIVPADGDKTTARRGAFTATPRTWDGKDYGTLVGQLRDAIGELGDSIAADLEKK